MAKILVIDDEKAIRDSLKDILEYEGHQVTPAENGIKALEILEKENFQVTFCDIKMPQMDGIELLEKASEKDVQTAFVMISGHADIDIAVETIKKGAFDFIQKPLDLNRTLLTLKNALEKGARPQETKKLKRRVSRKYKMIGTSECIKQVHEMIDKVALTDARVLITGDNGTGKELVAHRIYEKSNRKNKPFVEVNCAAIPSELIDSELFGHEKGSFTSADKQRIGKFEQANGGTLFLDEIGDMSLAAQAKVLRALQENTITRVGSDKSIKVDVRIIAATNKNLQNEILEKRFREDLYHRLSIILIHVPSLNDRPEDIPLLVKYFLKEISQEHAKTQQKITPEALLALQEKEWHGNIRELRNVVERMVILCGEEITEEDVNSYVNFY